MKRNPRNSPSECGKNSSRPATMSPGQPEGWGSNWFLKKPYIKIKEEHLFVKRMKPCNVKIKKEPIAVYANKRRNPVKERFVLFKSHHERSTGISTSENQHLNQTKSASRHSVIEENKKKELHVDSIETSTDPEVITPINVERRTKKTEFTRIEEVLVKKEKTDSKLNVDKGVPCSQCSKMFSSHDTLKKHMNSHQSKKTTEDETEAKPLYRCAKCEKDKCFHYAASIVTHLEGSHMKSGEKKIKCCFPLCDFKGQNDVLLRHMRSHHTKEYLFPCNLCPKKLASYEALKTHEKNHSTKNQCGVCRRFFTQETCNYCKFKHSESGNSQQANDKNVNISTISDENINKISYENVDMNKILIENIDTNKISDENIDNGMILDENIDFDIIMNENVDMNMIPDESVDFSVIMDQFNKIEGEAPPPKQTTDEKLDANMTVDEDVYSDRSKENDVEKTEALQKIMEIELKVVKIEKHINSIEEDILDIIKGEAPDRKIAELKDISKIKEQEGMKLLEDLDAIRKYEVHQEKGKSIANRMLTVLNKNEDLSREIMELISKGGILPRK